MVYLFLAEGFEEIEALGTLDLLLRSGIDVKTVSVNDENTVTGAHKIRVIADITCKEAALKVPDMIILPGGMPGTVNLEKSEFVINEIKSAAKDGRYIAAICAAPSILGKLSLLDGRKACCYPGYEKYFGGRRLTLKAYRDGNIITSSGPGTFQNFAFEIIKALKGEEKAAETLSSALFDFTL